MNGNGNIMKPKILKRLYIDVDNNKEKQNSAKYQVNDGRYHLFFFLP